MNYTVKEIAEALSVSKPTVQKYINTNKIRYAEKKSNKYLYYSYDDTIKIIKGIKPDFDFSVLIEKPQNKTENKTENTDKTTENIDKITEKVENKIEKPTTTENYGELEVIKTMLEMLQKELEKKDKQLEVKDEQIKDLNNRLAEANEHIKGLQVLSAADKKLLVEQQKENIVSAEVDIKEPDGPVETGKSAASLKRETEAGTEETTKQEKPQKKSFWKRLFNRE